MDNKSEMNNLITTSQGEQDFQEGGNNIIVSFYNRPVGGGVTQGLYIMSYCSYLYSFQFPVSDARLKIN